MQAANYIAYQRRPRSWKYIVAAPCSIATGIVTPDGQQRTLSPYLSMAGDGLLLIAAGYAWDGPSGPTPIDSRCAMRASLVHDALYQMIGDHLLPESSRDDADRLFRRMLREDGMHPIRAWLWYRAVRRFGGGHIRPTTTPATLTAP